MLERMWRKGNHPTLLVECKLVQPLWNSMEVSLKTQNRATIWKYHRLGKIEGRRRSGWQRMRWLDSITDSMDMCLNKLREIVKDKKSGMLNSMGSQRIGHNWAMEKQDDPTICLCTSWRRLLYNSKSYIYPTLHCSTLYHSHGTERT